MSKKLAFISTSSTYFFLVASVYAQDLVTPGDGFVDPGTGATGAQNDIGKLVSTVVQWLFIIAAILAVVYLIMGGIKWITSRGDKAGVEAARKQIVSAIIGLVVVAAAFLVLNIVFNVLGINNPLSPGGFTLPTLDTSTN